MADENRFKFVNQLAEELENGDIHLPSLPDVVVKIRDMLERDQCDFAQASQVISMDPVLASRLMVFANSAYHSRGGVPVENLDSAVRRLGFETVRNTALSIAVKQLYFSKKNASITDRLRHLWAHSMKLSSMAMAVAKANPQLNEETAFLCGLLHDVGKLYILAKAKDFPDLLRAGDALEGILDDWHGQVGRRIVEAWGFADEVVMSIEPQEYVDAHADSPPSMPDVMLVATFILQAGNSQVLDHRANPSVVKLGIADEHLPALWEDYQAKLISVKEALSFR